MTCLITVHVLFQLLPNELKNFMIRQIEDSIKFDCNINYYNTPTVQQTPYEWVTERKSMLEPCGKRRNVRLTTLLNAEDWL